jgi:hypothetical protein
MNSPTASLSASAMLPHKRFDSTYTVNTDSVFVVPGSGRSNLGGIPRTKRGGHDARSVAQGSIPAQSGTSSMMPHNRLDSAGGGGSGFTVPGSRPTGPAGLVGARGGSVKHLHSLQFKTPGRSCCGGCSGGGSCDGGSSDPGSGGGTILEQSLAAGPQAGDTYGVPSKHNKNITIKKNGPCEATVYLHLRMAFVSNCSILEQRSFQNELEAAVDLLFGKKSCTCIQYNKSKVADTAMCLANGAPVGRCARADKHPKNKCHFSVKVVWHKSPDGDGDKLPGMPLTISLNCKKGASMGGLTQPGKWITITYDPDAPGGSYRRTSGLGNAREQKEYERDFKKQRRLAEKVNLVVIAHELGHNMLNPYPCFWKLNKEERKGAKVGDYGHNRNPKGLMHKKPQLPGDKLSAEEICLLVCAMNLCDMARCCRVARTGRNGGPTTPGPTTPGPTGPKTGGPGSGPVTPGPTPPGVTDFGPTTPGPTTPGPATPGPTNRPH